MDLASIFSHGNRCSRKHNSTSTISQLMNSKFIKALITRSSFLKEQKETAGGSNRPIQAGQLHSRNPPPA